MSLTENKKYIRLAYLKSRYSTDSFGYDSYSDEDFAFEKMSDEMFADSERPLKNPRVPGCDPHKVPSKGSGDGECYQVHQDYGTAKSGENGSDERKQYMVEYRKHYYNHKTGPKDGMGSRKIVPKPKGDKHDRSQKKEATLISELRQERMGLLKMAYDHPHLRGEIMPLLKKKAYRKSKSEKVKKPCKPLKNFLKENVTKKDRQQYLEDHKNGKNTGGECYDIYHAWGKAPGKGGNRKEYYKWYNSKVRGKDPSAKTITRNQKNRKQIADATSFTFFSGTTDDGEKTMKSLKKWFKDEKIPEAEWDKYIKDEKYLPKTDDDDDDDDLDFGGGSSSSSGGGSSSSSSGGSKKTETKKTETKKTETPKGQVRTVTPKEQKMKKLPKKDKGVAK